MREVADNLIETDNIDIALNIAYKISSNIVGYSITDRGLVLYSKKIKGIVELEEENYTNREFILALVAEFLGSEKCLSMLEKVEKPKQKKNYAGDYSIHYKSYIVANFDKGTERTEVVIVKPYWKFNIVKTSK